MIGRTKAQRVHGSDGAGTHGEHIAQDSAHTRACTLKGFDEAGVIVAFHLEDDGLAVTEVYHACIFTRPLDHARAFGRQGFQPFLGGFIRAMLVPHG